MKLQELLKDVAVKNSTAAQDIEIKEVRYDSRAVQPGDLFVAIRGYATDGHKYIAKAMEQGAAAVVCEEAPEGVPAVVVENSRIALAEIAANRFGHPAESMVMLGVTGTNGKTTTTYLVEHIARVAGMRTGVIGTVGIQIGDDHEKSEHTTPESPDLQRMFARMRDSRCGAVAMEVSSHALDLERTWKTRFAVTAFTNLTQDHLDYHKTFDAYFEAKALLFSRDYPARRVINVNDKWGQELLRRCTANGDSVITTGFDAAAQIHPVEIDYAATHTDIVLDVRGNRVPLSYPLVGRFNVENVMTAFAVGMQLGVSVDVIVEALSDVPSVPGRLERVKSSRRDDISVYVDYAHTPDALAKAISSIKALSQGRTIVVFGCGGNRDSSKRSIMGEAALAADYAVVTSDNPRHEDPLAIIDDILAGMGDGRDRFEVEPDRRRAIARAIELSAPGDCILLAGKGHEDYQLVGDEVLPFDDRIVAAEELDRDRETEEGE